jgi:2-dehydro-3-deoxy-D-arabinonate dehydratase
LLSSSIKENSRTNYKEKYASHKIYKTNKGIVLQQGNDFFLSKETDWDKFINRKQLFKKVNDEVKGLKANSDLSELIKNNSAAPISNQEIWAAEVTYLRSREAGWKKQKTPGEEIFMLKSTRQVALNFFLKRHHIALSGREML